MGCRTSVIRRGRETGLSILRLLLGNHSGDGGGKMPAETHPVGEKGRYVVQQANSAAVRIVALLASVRTHLGRRLTLKRTLARPLARMGSALIALGVAGFLAAGVLAAPSAIHDAPPGATALCKDGTYSLSQTRSGTCSHHGGVAQWLAPSTTPVPTTTPPTTTTTATSTTMPTTAQPTGNLPVNVGVTVLLARQKKTSGCKLGPNPDRRCSPGAYSSELSRSVLCSPGFHTSTIRHVSDADRHAVEVEYGMQPRGYGSTLEIDHIISLELGGSNAIANLYPERAPGFHVKDKLENRLHQMVCSGSIALRAAQQGIAQNWQTLYVHVFGTQPNVVR